MSLSIVGIVVMGLIIALVTIGLVAARLYRRASKEQAFVRTGLGGEKVIKDGGALVLPVFHDVIPVGMNTLRLEVERRNDRALITADRMRVDVSAEFYVRVSPTTTAISLASQTLGDRTTAPDRLKSLVEGKFVDALRAVAAGMRMEELHEQRSTFVQLVKKSVAEDLGTNGLELEAVSLTGLDQTKKEYFNADNAFDAEGLTELTRQIEDRRKQRNDIERDTQVAIEEKNLEAERKTLDIKRETSFAQFEQKKQVDTRRAATEADTKAEQAQRHREAEEATISADTAIGVARERSTREQAAARIEREQAIQIRQQEAAISVAQKSEEESAASALADAKRADAVQAAERVETAREVEVAERRKKVRLVAASEDAEEKKIQITVAAQADLEAAEHRAQAVEVEANADAAAVITRANADERRLAVVAEGQRLLNEARKVLTHELVNFDFKVALLRDLPKIIEQQVKPMERIGDINIMDVRGLNGGGAGGGAAAPAGGGNLAQQAVAAALQYRTHLPFVDKLLKDVGLNGDGNLQDLIPASPAADDGPVGDVDEAAADAGAVSDVDDADQAA